MSKGAVECEANHTLRGRLRNPVMRGSRVPWSCRGQGGGLGDACIRVGDHAGLGVITLMKPALIVAHLYGHAGMDMGYVYAGMRMGMRMKPALIAAHPSSTSGDG